MSKQEIRVPPHNDEAEKCVLGAIFLDNKALDEVAALVKAEDFYRESSRHTYRAMVELASREAPIDVITVSDTLQGKGLLDAVGGPGWIMTLASETPTSANVGYYAKIVRERAALRSYIGDAQQILADAYAGIAGFDDIADRIERTTTALASRRHGSEGARPVAEGIREVFRSFEDEQVPGIPTGFEEIDDLFTCGGWQGGRLVVIGARPGMGKSALASGFLLDLATRPTPVPCALYTLEMGIAEVTLRIMSSMSRVAHRYVTGRIMTEQQWARIVSIGTKLKDAPLYIDDTPSHTVESLRSDIRRLVREHGVKVVAIDYLQLLTMPRADSRQQAIGVVTRALKQLARELDITILLLAQLNRGLESRADKRPLMSDLRESGDIEQDADVVAMVYRDEVYDEDSQDAGIAEVLVRKNRLGAPGVVRLKWIGEMTRFETMA